MSAPRKIHSLQLCVASPPKLLAAWPNKIMEFIAPIPFAEAIQKLGDQPVIGSTFSASEWGDLPVELRDNAFFSSRIESARVLQRAKDLLAGKSPFKVALAPWRGSSPSVTPWRWTLPAMWW